MPKASRICCIPGCDNSPTTTKKINETLKFYKFPNGGPFTSWRSYKRQQWIDAVGLQNEDGTPWEPTKNTVICSAHFVGGEKSENPLGPSYLPTLFPTMDETPTDSKSSGKAVRILRKKGTKSTETGSNPSGKKPSASGPVRKPASSLFSQIIPELKVFTLKIAYPNTKSVKCQANLPDQENQPGINCFTCIMRVENNVCNAEVQVTIPSKVDQAVGGNEPLNTVHKRDVACGPNVSDKQEPPAVCFQGISSIKTDAELMDFCGVSSTTFELILSLLPDIPGKKLDATNKLLVFLMRLKLGLGYTALSVLFNVHRSTVGRTFVDILKYLPTLLEEYIYWPSKAEVHKNVPIIFKPNYSNCRVIIDCVEIRVETPAGNELRKLMYSNSKRAFTIKFLLGFTPNGFISFKSKHYGGATSNEFIAKDSGFLDYIEPGDSVIADNRFLQLKMNVEEKKAAFFVPQIPEKLTESSSDIEEARKITLMRNHIERSLKRIQIFSILSFLPADMLPHADSLIHICCALINLQLLPVPQGK